ncbi:MAG TPA: hypothetical protein DCS93_08330, partial [Microscillaceae bacterium]|nr:hypothetical protein [Microscillaceae bacterium]
MSQQPLIQHIASVSHEGKVAIIGTTNDGVLYYSIRQSGFEDTVLKESNESINGFEPWKKLSLDAAVNDDSVLAHEQKNLTDKDGKPLLKSRYGSNAKTVKSALGKVEIVSAMGHLYVFRMSTDHCLLVNRFILDGIKNELIPKLEVRYSRSKQKYTPDGGESKDSSKTHDSLNFRDMDENPFYEPAKELTFIKNLHTSTPWFSVVLLETAEREKYRWGIFVYDTALKKVVIYSVAASKEGLFELKDKVVIQPDPENESKKILTQIPGIIRRELSMSNASVAHHFSATLFNHQIERATKAGTQLMKEDTRVMLAIPVETTSNGRATAVINFAVNNRGLLSQIDQKIDQSDTLRGKIKELLLPLTTLDDIKLMADTSPTPMGSIKSITQTEDEFISIASHESISALETGKEIKITGTQSYDGHFVAQNVTETGFEIATKYNGSKTGFWEVVEEENKGLVFENMIASYEKTEEGLLKITCPAHNLQEGDEIQIKGSKEQDGKYPIRGVNEDNSFVLDMSWTPGELVNLSRVKRRGIYFDGEGDAIKTGAIKMSKVSPKIDQNRTISVWVNMERYSDQEQVLVSQQNSELVLKINAKNQLTFIALFADGTKATLQSKDPFPLNGWVHVAGVVSHTANSTEGSRCYMTINGEKVQCSGKNIEDNEYVVAPGIPAHLPAEVVAFNGKNNYLAIDKMTYKGKNLIKNICVESWVYLRRVKSGQVIASFDREQYWQVMAIDKGKGALLRWSTNTDNKFQDLFSKTQLSYNQWHHVAVVYNAKAKHKQIYINGQLDVQKTAHGGKGLGNGQLRFGMIGAESDASTFNGAHLKRYLLKGMLAEFRIWNDAPGLETIQERMQQTCVGNEKGLVANWTLSKDSFHGKGKKFTSNAPGKFNAHLAQAMAWEMLGYRIPGFKMTSSDADAIESSFTLAAQGNKSYFTGKLSNFQVWNHAFTAAEIKDRMFLDPMGNEMNLWGYWKLGGIIKEDEQRLTPDFSVNGADATVLGEAYVSACELLRENSLGKAVKFSNGALVAVSQGATYRETFEFRVQDADGDFWDLAALNNADGLGHPIFTPSVWGKSSRSADKVTQITGLSVAEFQETRDGWFKASATFVVPEGVSFIRSFEIDKVSGKWIDQTEKPEEEWQMLEVRKHGIELISDSITQNAYNDVLDLKWLANEQKEVEKLVQEVPSLEEGIATKRKKLDATLEELSLYANVQKFENEKANLTKTVADLKKNCDNIVKEIKDLPKDPLNYIVMIRGKESNKYLSDLSGIKFPFGIKVKNQGLCIYKGAKSPAQFFIFEPQGNGYYKIQSMAGGRYLTMGDGQKKRKGYFDSKDAASQYWSLKKRAGGWYSLHNKAHGYVLDVEGHGTKDFSPLHMWNYHGKGNQLWQMQSIGKPAPHLITKLKEKETALKKAQEELKLKQNRLALVTNLLKNRSKARYNALVKEKDRLIKAINDEQKVLAQKNNAAVKAIGAINNEPQVMDMLARDGQGLQTYAALLGFAAPAHGLETKATAEGNVQLSYFDAQGCMRFTQYDAAADSVNSTFEQWLPESVKTCAHFRDVKDVCLLNKDGVAIDKNSWTIETWFYYPLAYQTDGSPYPLAKLVSNKTGKDAAIAVAENTRLGTLVDGYFHEAGVDLQEHLAEGWHHVAASGTAGATQFYLNGEAVGHSIEDIQSNTRYAMRFNGSKDYLKVPSIKHNFSKGFTLSCWAYFEDFKKWSRIIDFSKGGSASDNILLANEGTTNNLCFSVRRGDKGANLTAKGVLQKNTWMHLAVSMDSSGMTSLYVNGKEVAYGALHLPNHVERKVSYIGKSNWSNDALFKGSLSNLQLWSKALSGSEIQDNMSAFVTGEESGLLSYWAMNVKEIGDKEVAADSVEASKLNATIVGAPVSSLLDPQTSDPITAIGNAPAGGAPAGKLTEMRIWNVALSEEEIRVNSKIKATGNEPDLEAYYPLTDSGSGKAKDLSAFDQVPGTYKAVDTLPNTAPIGQRGSHVLSFDGKSSYLKIKGFNLRKKSFTVEFWALRASSDTYDFIVSQGSSSKNKGLHYGFRNSNILTQAFYGNDLNGKTKFETPKWMHVSMVYDAKGKVQRTYVNGKLAGERKKAAVYQGTGDLYIGRLSWGGGDFEGQLSDLRIWKSARSAQDIQNSFNQRLTGTEKDLLGYWPLEAVEDGKVKNLVAKGKDAEAYAVKALMTNNLPLIPGTSLVTAEYNTVGSNPDNPATKRAMLRRFFAFANQGGHVNLYPGKRIEELLLKWIGNAQFEPTLLGYIEGAPPVPSENLTVNYDYDGATTVQLTQSEDTSYSWMRTKDSSQGVDLNMFLGVGWGAEGGFGVVSKLSEGKAGFRGMMNLRDGKSSSSTIRANSTSVMSDKLELRGSYETTPKFEDLGNRYLPKNVGYALVVSGMADVFITQMKRTGRMIGYEILPVEDIPMDINTITFMINPAYTQNGSLDGLVGSRAADDRFYGDVPEMRAQYGSLYPASYYRLKEAYDLKAQIDRWDKERESYFVNFDATQTTVSSLEDQTADESEYDNYGSVSLNADTEAEVGEDGEEKTEKELRDEFKESSSASKKKSDKEAKKRKAEIQAKLDSQEKQVEAESAFESWQKRMENLQIRAAKRNIVNTYVWDADGGIRSEEQSFANTVEHTIGGSFNLTGSLGLDTDVMVTGFKFELSALYAMEMTQTMNKTKSTTTGFDLNIRLDGVERKGVTDEKDYPIIPGEKVDRYRFMSFYLEGNTDHFNDFFSQVVDPEWL